LEVGFDDPKSVASAGLVLPMSVAQQLNIEPQINAGLTARGLGGKPNAGAKALTMVSSLLAGGEFISDVDMLASGATGRVLGHQVFSASRCGEWLRILTPGDVHILGGVNMNTVGSAWRSGLGPDTVTATDPGNDDSRDGDGGDDDPLVLDIDSTVIATYGAYKAGASKRNYRGIKGYHPLIISEATTGQVLSGLLREGNAAPAKDAAGLIDATLKGVRETVGSTQHMVLRADSGFYTKAVIDTCRSNQTKFSVTIRRYPPVNKIITNISNDEYRIVSKTASEIVDVAGIGYQVKGRTGTDPVNCRLIVRRTTIPKDTGDPQQRLFDLVDHWAFVTDLEGDPKDLDVFHRKHAVVEAVIRDLKHGMALDHMPSGRYHANAGWLQLNILAHNLARWTGRLISPTVITTKTLRHRYLNCPGRITKNSRKYTLRLPTHWPWKTEYLTALDHIRSLDLVD